MAGLLKKILPVVKSIPKEEEDDDDFFNVEYSTAVVYSGPPVTYDIPRVVPVDISQIPIAATVVSGTLLNDTSFPVIQPIVKSNKSNKKLSKEPKLGPDRIFYGNDMSCTSPPNGDISNVHFCKSNMSDDGGCSSSCDGSHESSGRLKVLGLHDGSEDAGKDFQDDKNSDNSSKEDEIIEEAPCHVRRPSTVTFRDPESNDVFQEESELSEDESTAPVRKVAVRPGKKGTCYRCLKGNRFTEKEICIVCSAKYCGSCVLRAMGSMPQGRKCVTCIDEKIDEDRRKMLGKCSRMLKQLLPDEQVKQIMMAERICKVNQLPPELVHVNGERLSAEELFQLQFCPNPLKKLQPGYYWYDKVSGFWGKEGEKPCQIISPQMNVGGHIQRNASNGNTNILINNREITKPELVMLQFAGVKCEGTTSFWLSADGSYQEEGMNNVKGNIWKNNRVKLICAVLSLPTPPNSGPSGEVKSVMPSNIEQKTLSKLLIVGCKKSGTSTIFKNAKMVYNVPFSNEERQNIKFMIQSNLYGYLGILLEGRERFEEEMRRRFHGSFYRSVDDTDQIETDAETIYSIGPELKAFSDRLLKIMASGNLETISPASTEEYAPVMKDLWEDAAIQATYNRRSELESLPRVATYFLERAVEIARTDYEPSDMDILYAEGMTSSKGLSFMEFSFPELNQEGCDNIGYQHDTLMRYQLIRVNPGILGGNCKRLEMFEDVDIVLFVVSLSDYDQFYKDSNGVTTNKMMASRKLFESIVTHPTFEKKSFLLVLNKFDLLEEKIEKIPLSCCEWFQDFNPVIGHNPNTVTMRNTNPSLAHRAFQYIAVKFKKLFLSLTDKKLFVSLVSGLESDSVDEALRYTRDILKWNEEVPNYSINELSSTSLEASSSS